MLITLSFDFWHFWCSHSMYLLLCRTTIMWVLLPKRISMNQLLNGEKSQVVCLFLCLIDFTSRMLTGRPIGYINVLKVNNKLK
jgi:hypothetical protein